MAVRGAKPKKAGTRHGGKPASKKQPSKSGSVLGNDPFERGAAVRPAAPLAPVGPAPEASHPSAPPIEAAPPVEAAPPIEAAPSVEIVAPSPGPVEEIRAKLGAVESRVEAFATSAAARLGELARQDATGQHARDLLSALRSLLPALRDRMTTLAGFGAVLLSSGEVDAYGFDQDLVEGLAPVIDFLYASWWRVDARDIDRVPPSGPVVLVANHGGILPWDALVLRTALRRDHPAHRDLRPLLDEHALARRLSGTLARRLGAVAATPENATHLLEQGGVIAVFPEGSRGSTRPWADRYRIQRFGRGGFARLALRIGAPVVPCAIVGSEETALPMARAGWLSSALGMPFLTSPPPLPFVPLGALPLPARWSLRFGAPIDTAGAGPDAAADGSRVLELTERVRAALQQMLDEDVAARRSVYL